MILKIVKNRTVTLYEECAHESEFFTNGTFKLGNAMKRHSGDYVLEEFGSDGVLVKKVTVHLEIQGRLKCFPWSTHYVFKIKKSIVYKTGLKKTFYILKKN